MMPQRYLCLSPPLLRKSLIPEPRYFNMLFLSKKSQCKNDNNRCMCLWCSMGITGHHRFICNWTIHFWGIDLLPDLPLRAENILEYLVSSKQPFWICCPKKTVKMNQICNNVSRMPVYFINPSIKSMPLKCKDYLKVLHWNYP